MSVSEWGGGFRSVGASVVTETLEQRCDVTRNEAHLFGQKERNWGHRFSLIFFYEVSRAAIAKSL